MLLAFAILISGVFVGCSQVKPEEKPSESVQESTSETEPSSTTETTTESTTETTDSENKPTGDKSEPTTNKKGNTNSDKTFVSSSAAKTAADKFYQDAVFIGDSVSMGLRTRAVAKGKFPGAKYLVRGSFGSGHAIKGTMLLTYQGKEMSPEDAVKASGAKKVFIMLGMNDLNIYGLKGSADNLMTLIKRIRKKSPNVKIYIQSMTPIVNGAERGKLNNTSIDEYNGILKSYAAKNNCIYVDVATNLKDSNNGLRPKFSSDNYVHLSAAGTDVWIATLEAFAERQMNLQKPETTTKPPKPETTTKPQTTESTTTPPTETTTQPPESTTTPQEPEGTTTPQEPETTTESQSTETTTGQETISSTNPQ